MTAVLPQPGAPHRTTGSPAERQTDRAAMVSAYVVTEALSLKGWIRGVGGSDGVVESREAQPRLFLERKALGLRPGPDVVAYGLRAGPIGVEAGPPVVVGVAPRHSLGLQVVDDVQDEVGVAPPAGVAG